MERSITTTGEFGIGFTVVIKVHSADGWLEMDSPEAVRETIGAAFDDHGLQEEIDYTLEISRRYA